MAIGSAARLRRRPSASPDGRMTLVEHLRELRYRIIIAAAAVVVAVIVAFVFHGRILHLLTGPYCALPRQYHQFGKHCTLVVGGVLDGFTVSMKLSIWTGLVAASPIWLWQLWRFITPGLYRHERRWAISFVAASVGLFCLGGFFAWLVLTRALHFLLGFATGNGLTALLTFDSYLSFVVTMVLVFAVSFELPLVIVLLNLAGVVSYARLKKWSRGIIFAIFVFAGGATPSGDPISMLGLAVPMTVLYGIAVALAYVHDRREARKVSPYAGLADDEASPIEDSEDLTPEDDMSTTR